MDDALLPPPQDPPTAPVRYCRDCGRPVPRGPLRLGLGDKCARRAGLVQPRRRALPRPRAGPDGGPTLLDLITDDEEMTMTDNPDKPADLRRRAVAAIDSDTLIGLLDLPPTARVLGVNTDWATMTVQVMVTHPDLPVVDECMQAPTMPTAMVVRDCGAVHIVTPLPTAAAGTEVDRG